MRGAAVLVIQIIGVLPDVEGEEGLEALRHGIAGVGLLGDDEGAVLIGGEPDPAGAEEADAFGFEIGLKNFYTPPLLDDLVFQRSIRQGLTAGGELREVHLVVQYLTGIVEDSAGTVLDNVNQ